MKTFPIITDEIQRGYEADGAPLSENIPMICGICGRACRQMGKDEGANRMPCTSCPLSAYASKWKTITAKQVPEEWQRSPIMDERLDDLDDIIFSVGDVYTDPAVESLTRNFVEAAYYLDEIKRYGKAATYANVTELVNDYFPAEDYRPNKGRYSTRDIHNIRWALEQYSEEDFDRNEHLSGLLTALTGDEWREWTLRGAVQRDWQTVLYRAKFWPNKRIARLEAELFNMGSEWEIYLADEHCHESAYCTEWSEEGIRREIAEQICAFPGSIELVFS